MEENFYCVTFTDITPQKPQFVTWPILQNFAKGILSTIAVLPCSFYSMYQTLKIAVLALFMSVLILAFLLLLVLSRDAIENCGSYCPHSPVHLLYTSLEPYIHLHRDHPTVI